MTLQAEKRRSERKVTNLSVRYKIGNTRVTAFTHDFNQNGMFLESDVLVDEGEVLPLDFTLMNKRKKISGFGRVVYKNCNAEESANFKSRGMGIELLDCSKRDEALIAAYLADRPMVNSKEDLEVVKVMSKRDLDRFIDLPFFLYKDNPYWVPPLKKQMKETLTDLNPFFQHGEMDLFLVEENGRAIGRIAAIIDYNFINLYKEKIGYFGFFESIPDFNVAVKLFDAVARHLKEKGMEKIRGPVSPSLNDEICFLAEGFDVEPNVMMPFNPLFYNNFVRGYGMYKLKDFLSFTVDLTRELPQELLDLLKGVEKKGVHFRPFDMKYFSRDVELLRQLNNQSWLEAGHWGFVPITPDEMTAVAEHFRKLGDPDIIYFVEVSGKPAGYVLNLPNFYPSLKYLNGGLNPIGIIKFLYHIRHVKNVRAVSVGVLKEFCGMDLATALFVKAILEMQKKGYHSMEYVWVLEDNKGSKRIVSKFGGKLYKKYKMYEYSLNDNLSICCN